jgi:hypothetical protein
MSFWDCQPLHGINFDLALQTRNSLGLTFSIILAGGLRALQHWNPQQRLSPNGSMILVQML